MIFYCGRLRFLSVNRSLTATEPQPNRTAPHLNRYRSVRLFLDSTVPHDFKWKFRSLDQVKRWKASEKQNFFLHASLPVLKHILLSEIFYHHLLLVTSVRLLCEYSITDQQIDIVKAMLLGYTRLLPELYDMSEATFNSHAIPPFAFKPEACKIFHVCLRFKRNVPGGNLALLTNET